jgi:hypothetical protein
VLAQRSTARTRFAGSALRWCAGRRMTRTTRTRTRTLLDATRGREASSTASGAAGATTMTATGGRRPRRCVPLARTAPGRSAPCVRSLQRRPWPRRLLTQTRPLWRRLRCAPLVQTAGGRSAPRAQSLRLRRRRLQRWRPLQRRHRPLVGRAVIMNARDNGDASTISRTAFTPVRNSGGIWCASKPPSNVAAPNARRGSETKNASWRSWSITATSRSSRALVRLAGPGEASSRCVCTAEASSTTPGLWSRVTSLRWMGRWMDGALT